MSDTETKNAVPADENGVAKPATASKTPTAETASQTSKSGEIAQGVAEAVATDNVATDQKASTAPKKAASASKPAAKKPVAKKAAAKKPAAKKAPTTKSTARKTAKAKTTSRSAATPTRSTKKTRDTIMANSQKTKSTTSGIDMTADIQDRMQAAYAKANEFASDAGEFGKENVEAMVESGKIFFSGAQALMQEEFESGKTAVDTLSEDAKKAASVKSPTELMQMQSEIARRNFDAMMSYGSQRTEAWVKLYNEAFAPLSNRASVATEKFSKVA